MESKYKNCIILIHVISDHYNKKKVIDLQSIRLKIIEIIEKGDNYL